MPALGRHLGGQLGGEGTSSGRAHRQRFRQGESRPGTGAGARDQETGIQMGWVACASYMVPVSPGVGGWGEWSLSSSVVIIVDNKNSGQRLANISFCQLPW